MQVRANYGSFLNLKSASQGRSGIFPYGVIKIIKGDNAAESSAQSETEVGAQWILDHSLTCLSFVGFLSLLSASLSVKVQASGQDIGPLLQKDFLNQDSQKPLPLPITHHGDFC